MKVPKGVIPVSDSSHSSCPYRKRRPLDRIYGRSGGLFSAYPLDQKGTPRVLTFNLGLLLDATKALGDGGLVTLRSHAANQAPTRGAADFVQPNTISRCPISTSHNRLLKSISCLVLTIWTNSLDKIIR